MNKKEYLLICLAEELGEFQKEVFKCLRFGINNWCEETNCTNKERANKELSDVVAILLLLMKEDCSFEYNMSDVRNKLEKFKYYFEKSKEFEIVK